MHIADDAPSRQVQGVQSLRRAVGLLREVMSESGQGCSALELASRTGLDRTTIHRMLKCLVEEGLLAPADQRARYVLGPLALQLGAAAQDKLDLRTLCTPAMERIADETGDTVFLMLRVGAEAVCIQRTEGRHPVKTFVVDVGARRPLGVGAGSLAMLCALPSAEADAALARNGRRMADYSGMTETRIRALIPPVLRSGYAAGEVIDVPGARAIGVAIRDGKGHPLGSLSVASIIERMAAPREQALAAILQREAAAIRSAIEGRA